MYHAQCTFVGEDDKYLIVTVSEVKMIFVHRFI